jgi:hypothetical protein
MVGNNTSRDLYFASIFDVTCCGFQKEEGFLWNRITQFLDMICVVSANGNYLVTYDKYLESSIVTGMSYLFALLHKLH